jgi:hypothetical protein
MPKEQSRAQRMISLFQTATGSWHLPSILMASSWVLGTALTGFFMFANLRVNRNDRISAFEKEQKSIAAAGEARAKIAELEEKTKPVPLKKRLTICLEGIDKRIIPALHAGTTRFGGNLVPYQLTELQKLAAEDTAAEFIILRTGSGIVFMDSGTATPVEFELKPALIQ